VKKYFCYSSALDTTAFEEWAAGHGFSGFRFPQGTKARALSWKYCFDFPSRYWGGRVLSLAPTTNSEHGAWGILFEVEDKDWGMIQHKEGVVTGVSVETELEVLVNGEKQKAFAFLTNPTRRSEDGPLSQQFLEVLKRCYAHWGLPPLNDL
jgi:cation transport regulator ChaC